MICPYCEGLSLSQSQFYQISNVKQRFNPTYYHHPIFSQPQPGIPKVRCSPTYHSRALNVDGYHCCQKKKPMRSTISCQKMPKSTYQTDFRKTKDEPFKNYKGNNCYNSRCQWYDSGKDQVFCDLNQGRGYSRERKIVDLASSEVFDGYGREVNVNDTLNNDQAEKTQKQQHQVDNAPQSKICDPNHQVKENDGSHPQQARDNPQNEKVAQVSAEKCNQQTQTFGQKKRGQAAMSTSKTKKKSKPNTAKTMDRPCFTVIRSHRR